MVSVRLMGFPPFGVGPAPLACLYYIIGIALCQEVFQSFFILPRSIWPGLFVYLLPGRFSAVSLAVII
nr:MAG TPA: hypothetical protein [Caudoviricetes sp.]